MGNQLHPSAAGRPPLERLREEWLRSARNRMSQCCGAEIGGGCLVCCGSNLPRGESAWASGSTAEGPIRWRAGRAGVIRPRTPVSAGQEPDGAATKGRSDHQDRGQTNMDE